jgi:serine/threonine protein kinase
MEFCSGGSLKKIMNRLKSPFSEDEIAAVCCQVGPTCSLPTSSSLAREWLLSLLTSAIYRWSRVCIICTPNDYCTAM